MIRPMIWLMRCEHLISSQSLVKDDNYQSGTLALQMIPFHDQKTSMS